MKANSPIGIAYYVGGVDRLDSTFGAVLPDAQVKMVEHHPLPASIALAGTSTIVHCVLATDVFEHVSDPIGVAITTGAHLHVGGLYLMANWFAPVIQCHLPQLFHLLIGRDQAMRLMALCPQERGQYGRACERIGKLD